MAGLPGFKGNVIPVVPGKLHGLRSFDVNIKEGTLHGISFKESWNDAENVATCHDETNKNKEHSMKDCDHGYWSYFGVSSQYKEKYRAHAIIEGYGEVIVGEKGFRAEKAKIKAVTVPSLKDILSHLKYRARHAHTESFVTLVIGLIVLSLSAGGLFLGFFTDTKPGLPDIADTVIRVVVIGMSLTMLFLAAFALLASKDYRAERKRLLKEIADIEKSGPVNWMLKQKELEAKVQEKYPDAILYSNVKEMVSANKDNIILHGMLLSAQ